MVLELGGNRQNGFKAAWNAMRSGRHVANIILPCLAVALEIYYSVCGGSCSYLKGELFSVPLQYVGIAYMALIVVLSLLKLNALLVMFLAAGVGIEVYLVGFQIWHNTYCPYCLAFGAIILVLFLLNVTSDRKKPAIISMAAALILFSIFFEGSATPSYASDSSVPVFGRGKINVRLYTDYFCHPCREMEPEVEPVLMDLVKNDRINLTFIDTPFSRYSSLYARYYLYSMSNKGDIEHAFAARTGLIEAAKKNIGDPARIEALLAEKGIKISPVDTKPAFALYGRMLKEDGIHSTPTCVIENNGKKEKASGQADIVNVLKNLK